jgi:hypothetical protein
MKDGERELALSGYLLDLGHLVREAAVEAKKTRNSAASNSRDFESGRLMAYNEVVSLMQQQAIAFDLSFKEIGLEDIDPDNDLV